MKNTYKIIQTKDLSYSFEYINESGHSEVMHHSSGAVEESFYIYFPAMEWCAQHLKKLNILSLGLGTGLNEMIAIAYGFLNKEIIESFYMESFESDPHLVETFKAFVFKEPLEETYFRAYATNLNLICRRLLVSPDQVLNELKNKMKQGQLVFRTALMPDTEFNDQFNCILYDLFSSKMSSLFWEEEFISKFILKSSQAQCCFATYASTGALKRALRSGGFQLIPKPGFSNKRESTLATRF